MGVPLLFTDLGGATPDLIVVPYPGLYLSDELYLRDDLYLDEGPVLEFYAVAPVATEIGLTISVDPVAVTFSATVPSLASTDATVVVFPIEVTFNATAPDVAGQDDVVSVTPVEVTFGATIPTTQGSQLLVLVPSVRELPPLRLHLDVETPSGRHFKWGEDEPNPANVPSGLRFSDTMPGGFENQDATLPRKPGTDYADLERLSTIRAYGAGGELAWEGRLERAPRVSGDQMSISPSAVGWQAHLEDDKSATATYIDRDLSHWRGMSINHQLDLLGQSYTPHESSTEADAQTGRPGLKLAFPGSWVNKLQVCEAFYDAGPKGKIAGIIFTPSYSATVSAADANWQLLVSVQDGDGTGTAQTSADYHPQTASQTFFPTPRRFGVFTWLYNSASAGVDGDEYAAFIRDLAVIGDTGLPIRNDGTMDGFLASDMINHAVTTHAPALKASYGGTDATISQSGFVVVHAVFQERTTAAEIVRQTTRFGLQDWAVWDDKTFWWHDRGARGRKWRARIGPAQLEETGPQVDRVWNAVIVQYQDVDGSTQTVGPVGSGVNNESPWLVDTDPENPANKAGIIRMDLLQAGVTTPKGAEAIGIRFLRESRLFDRSGRARLVGHVESDRGVLYPYWAVRAGDYITFVDSNDTSYRRIVKTEKDHASRTCNIDLDAPPEGLAALLERLGVGIAELGFS